MSISFPLERNGESLLLWVAEQEDDWRELPVRIVREQGSETVLWSSQALPEKVAVRLLHEGLSHDGTVRSCREEGSHFTLTIGITTHNASRFGGFERDPGVLALDCFMSEEAEQRILDEIENETGTKNGGNSYKRCTASLLNLVKLTAECAMCSPRLWFNKA